MSELTAFSGASQSLVPRSQLPNQPFSLLQDSLGYLLYIEQVLLRFVVHANGTGLYIEKCKLSVALGGSKAQSQALWQKEKGKFDEARTTCPCGIACIGSKKRTWVKKRARVQVRTGPRARRPTPTPEGIHPCTRRAFARGSRVQADLLTCPSVHRCARVHMRTCAHGTGRGREAATSANLSRTHPDTQ